MQIPRRVVVRSLVVGGPFLSTLSGLGAGTEAGAGPDDPVAAHILREATRLARELRTNPRRPETIAGIAANFRLHVAHGKATRLDSRVATALRRLITREGRGSLIDRATQIEPAHELLHTLQLDDLHVETRVLPRSGYEAALTMLTDRGVTPMLEHAAATFEALSQRIAKLTTPDGAVRVQAGVPCGNGIRDICEILKEAAAIICALSVVDPLFSPICAVIALEAVTACFLAYISGC